METNGSSLVVNIFFRFFVLLACIINLLISATEVFLLEVNVRSINDTFGVGTLIAVQSSLHFSLGRTKLKAFAATVDVGIIDIAAPLALLKSLCV